MPRQSVGKARTVWPEPNQVVLSEGIEPSTSALPSLFLAGSVGIHRAAAEVNSLIDNGYLS